MKKQKILKSNKNSALVSVIIPVYNAANYAKHAIESILNQTYKNIELIIVNDGSSDATQKVLNAIKRKYINHSIKVIKLEEHKGISEALNVGIRKSKGLYIARMDSDDWAYPNRIDSQVRFLQKHPYIGVLGSYIEVCDEELCTKYIKKYFKNDKEIKTNLFWFNAFAHPATMWRSEILRENPYNSQWNLVEDYELYIRLRNNVKFSNLTKPLIKYRTYINSKSFKPQIIKTLKCRRLLYEESTTKDILLNEISLAIAHIIPTKLLQLVVNISKLGVSR